MDKVKKKMIKWGDNGLNAHQSLPVYPQVVAKKDILMVELEQHVSMGVGRKSTKTTYPSLWAYCLTHSRAMLVFCNYKAFSGNQGRSRKKNRSSNNSKHSHKANHSRTYNSTLATRLPV